MANWTHEDMVGAARAIRGQLASLIDDYESVDLQLASLLAKDTNGEDVQLDLVDALTINKTLRDWTQEFLTKQHPPLASLTRFGGPDIPSVGPVSFDRYACPKGDFDWFRFGPGDHIPPCPTHHVTLLLVPSLNK